MLLPAPKFSAGLPTLDRHEFLSPPPARCPARMNIRSDGPDWPTRLVPALPAFGFFARKSLRIISSSLYLFIVIIPPYLLISLLS